MYLSCPDFHCSALAMHTQLPVVLGVLPTWDAIGKTRQTALPPARFCHPKWPRRLRMRVKWACLHNLGIENGFRLRVYPVSLQSNLYLTAHIMVNSETSVTETIGASTHVSSIGQGKCVDPGECTFAV